MAEMILKPSGISSDTYKPLFYKRDESSGQTLSKRKIAPLILDELNRQGVLQEVLRRMIEIAAGWSKFHLADNEYEARATVQKAREFLGDIEEMEFKESKEREERRKKSWIESKKIE